MTTSKAQECVDAAGRLAAVMNDLQADTTLLDVLEWCIEANVGLTRDTALAQSALELLD